MARSRTRGRPDRKSSRRRKATPAGRRRGRQRQTARRAKVDIVGPVFGYKTHVLIDHTYGFIRRFAVTSAAAHDGAQLANALDPANTASDV